LERDDVASTDVGIGLPHFRQAYTVPFFSLARAWISPQLGQTSRTSAARALAPKTMGMNRL
jgi:hypothetical protein